jgi:methylated-DNA-[protein]-cysteine S-methyltransferase
MIIRRTSVRSPIGHIVLEASDRGLTAIMISDLPVEPSNDLPEFLERAKIQMEEYVAGKRTTFDSLPLVLRGTDFQLSVWDGVAGVPYGETVTYGDLARTIGDEKSARAVGTALGKNPLCIIVPCHRVIPSYGGAGEYAYGTKAKEWLLRMEKIATRGENPW